MFIMDDERDPAQPRQPRARDEIGAAWVIGLMVCVVALAVFCLAFVAQINVLLRWLP